MKALLFIGLIFFANVTSAQFQIQYKILDANLIKTYILNNGVLNRNAAATNAPGFEWPKGSGKYAIFSTGFNIAGYVNNQLRMGASSFDGEFRPGYCINGHFFTDTTFHIYSVKLGDTQFNNPDHANWGQMIPYGAPFDDVNMNGIFELGIDKPGVKDAAQTIFVCLTDADTASHYPTSGFGGGTLPLGAEVRFTSYSYNISGIDKAQFLKWEIINKSINRWDSVFAAIYLDPDLGMATDDWVGCDTVRDLIYCYNSDNADGTGSGNSYGTPPPAVGIDLLKGIFPYIINSDTMEAFAMTKPFKNSSVCEHETNNALEAYRLIKGLKNDGTPVLNPITSPFQITRFYASGDPESGSGWTESDGRVDNCGGSLTGNIINSPGLDVRMLISTGSKHFSIMPGESKIMHAVQFMELGSNNLNSVTKLKTQSTRIQTLFNPIISIKNINSEISGFALAQNYPNPFNPVTKIQYWLPAKSRAKLTIYSSLGKEVQILVNEQQQAGAYEVTFDASQLNSGVYFYKLEADEFVETRKMLLIK